MASTNHQRIAINTGFLYVRMIFLIIINLYASRLVLNALGFSDYGIYNVVGGFVTMLAFLNNTLSVASQRFINIEIGKGESGNVYDVFSVCLTSHLILAILLTVITEIAGVYFLYYKMQISPERLSAAFWVLQFSIVSCFFLIISVPYTALITAYEKMDVYAYMSILEGCLKLGAVILLLHINYDRLIIYAFLIMLVQVLMRIMYSVYSRKKILRHKVRFSWDRNLVKRITAFSGWNIIGDLAGTLANQGVNVLLNIFFGTTVNAARGITTQVQSTIQGFVQSFQTSLNPQILKSYARGNLEEHRKLVLESSKLSFLLLLVVSMPVLVETEEILHLWLKNVPDYTGIFVRLAIVVALLNVTVNAPAMSMIATGKIKNYQLTTGMVMLLILPLSFLFLKIFDEPWLVYIAQFLIIIISQITRLFFVRHYVNLQIRIFFTTVYIPCILALLLSVLPPLTCRLTMQAGVPRLLASCSVSVLSTVLITYFIAFTKEERLFVNGLVRKVKDRIF